MRDNWCIGFSSDYSVGVWVGNFEGDAMHRVSGVTGAAPVWLTIMNALHAGSPGTEPKKPSNLIARTISFDPAVEPQRQEWFVPGTETKLVRLADPGSRRPSILSPPDGVTIALDPDIPVDKQRVLFSTSGLSDAILVLDGKTLRSRDRGKRAIHLIQVTSTGCGLAAVSPNQIFIPHRRRGHGLLNQSTKEFGTAVGLASAESERELVEVIIQMLTGDSTLVGTQQPPLQEDATRCTRGNRIEAVLPLPLITTTSSGNLSQVDSPQG